MKNYKNIIFDIGGVLLNYNPKKLIKMVFKDELPEALGLLDAFKTNVFLEISRGTYNFKQAAHALAPEFDEHKILTLFNAIAPNLTPLHEGLTIFNQVKAKGYKTYILSNINDECHNAIRHHDFFKQADGALFSYEYQCVKPEPEIYNKFLEIYSLKAEECLFIDDMPRNVNGARTCGIDSIVCNTHENVKKQLINLGVL